MFLEKCSRIYFYGVNTEEQFISLNYVNMNLNGHILEVMSAENYIE